MVSHWWECENFKLFFSWAEGYPYFKRGSVEFSTRIFKCIYFKLWAMNYFLNELGYLKPCESLGGAWETKTHSRTRNGCHMSTIFGLGRDNIPILIYNNTDTHIPIYIKNGIYNFASLSLLVETLRAGAFFM